LVLAGANHDPNKFDHPKELDAVRGGIGNLSFGAGLHFCIGTPLAKLEVAVALPILFAKYPDMKLAGPPVYADRYHFHGIEHLHVNLGEKND
jgi:cytochrome P450